MKHIYNILSADGAVENHIVADDAFVAEHYAGRAVLVGEAPADPPSAATPRHIAVGSFFDRFGAAKYEILADSNPAVQALIKDCSVRRYIDLDRPDLPGGLQLLVQAGHQVDPVQIVSAPVQPGEMP